MIVSDDVPYRGLRGSCPLFIPANQPCKLKYESTRFSAEGSTFQLTDSFWTESLHWNPESRTEAEFRQEVPEKPRGAGKVSSASLS